MRGRERSGLGRRMAGWLALVSTTVLTGLLIIVAPATPAFAHGRSSDATNFDSRIQSTPSIDGITWRMYGGDEYLSVDNASAVELLVLGYEGEPWLRVGPEGVFHNVRSAATYVNADRYAAVEVPATVDPEAAPEWEQLSDGSSWYWHDHRAHWMAPSVPPAVRADPDQARLVQDWQVPVDIAGESSAVTGELWWVPPPSVLPWLLAGLLVSLPALAGLARGRGGLALVRPAALILGLVAVANAFHLADDLFAAPAPWSAKLLAAAQTAVFIAVTAFGAGRGWQGREGAFTALGVGSAAAFVGQGLLYLPALTSSQLQSLVPEVIGRMAIGWSLAQVIPVGIVSVIGTRRMLPPADDGGGGPDSENVARDTGPTPAPRTSR